MKALGINHETRHDLRSTEPDQGMELPDIRGRGVPISNLVTRSPLFESSCIVQNIVAREVRTISVLRTSVNGGMFGANASGIERTWRWPLQKRNANGT